MQTVQHPQNQRFVQKTEHREQLMLKKNNKNTFYCENSAFVVPSGTIKEVTPAGTSALLGTLACEGGKNRKPRYYADNADLHCQWMLETQPASPSPPNRPGSLVCNDPALAGAVGRIETVANLRKTETGNQPQKPFKFGDIL